MKTTYTAILSETGARWVGPPPDEVQAGGEVVAKVEVSDDLPSESFPKGDGRRIVAILDQLAEMGSFDGMEDPVEWQRRIREDRPRP